MFIEETITSVLDQQYPGLEYIIIDGGSTDNTVEIIKKYEKYLKYWVSEKDGGQANAINKGLWHCTGDIFNWLNSDDYLEPGALNKIAAAFTDEKVQIVAGRVRNFSSKEEEIIQNQNLSAAGLMCWQPGVKFVQPGAWMKRLLLRASGGIDESFHFCFDWDLYIRYLYNFPVVKEIPELLVHFRLHEDSKTQTSAEKFEKDQQEIIEKLSRLSAYNHLHEACRYKIDKAAWTSFLSVQSKSASPFLLKFFSVITHLNSFGYEITWSRQTAGAVKAFLRKKTI